MSRERRYAREERAAAWVQSLVSRLPRRAALAFGRALGGLWADLDRRHVRIALDNLRRAYPHWSEERLVRTALGVYRHFGQVVIDLLWMQGRGLDEILALVDVEGREHAEAATADGRAALMLTGHFGNWELAGVVQGRLLGPIGVVARPLDNPALDARLCAFRAKSGNTVIYKRHALGQVLQSLRGGRSVAILIDQNVHEGGLFVDFFGRPAATTTVAAALVLKTGCAVLPGFLSLRRDGRYLMKYQPPIRWEGTGDRRADIASLTQRLSLVIEEAVREAPEQWLWLHRRWKAQPGDAAPSAAGEAAIGSETA